MWMFVAFKLVFLCFLGAFCLVFFLLVFFCCMVNVFGKELLLGIGLFFWFLRSF